MIYYRIESPEMAVYNDVLHICAQMIYYRIESFAGLEEPLIAKYPDDLL